MKRIRKMLRDRQGVMFWATWLSFKGQVMGVYVDDPVTGGRVVRVLGQAVMS
jgi:hypothetical protein